MDQTEINIASANILIDFKNLTRNREQLYQYHMIQLRLLGKLQLLWALQVIDGDEYAYLTNMLDNIPSNIKEIIDDMF